MPNHLNTNLTFLRKLFKLSQAYIASQLNKGQTTIGNWENNLTQPSVDDLLIIKQIFAISLDNLIETDLRDVKVSDLPAITKRPGIVEGNVKGSVKENVKKLVNYQDTPPLESLVNESDPAREWALFKLMKGMDEKIDRVLLSVEKKAE